MILLYGDDRVCLTHCDSVPGKSAESGIQNLFRMNTEEVRGRSFFERVLLGAITLGEVNVRCGVMQ
jgi:hypothetical protein